MRQTIRWTSDKQLYYTMPALRRHNWTGSRLGSLRSKTRGHSASAYLPGMFSGVVKVIGFLHVPAWGPALFLDCR